MAEPRLSKLKPLRFSVNPSQNIKIINLSPGFTSFWQLSIQMHYQWPFLCSWVTAKRILWGKGLVVTSTDLGISGAVFLPQACCILLVKLLNLFMPHLPLHPGKQLLIYFTRLLWSSICQCLWCIIYCQSHKQSHPEDAEHITCILISAKTSLPLRTKPFFLLH